MYSYAKFSLSNYCFYLRTLWNIESQKRYGKIALKWIWNEAVVNYFKVLSMYWIERIELPTETLPEWAYHLLP
jgi:hypothetical protein